MSVNFTIKKGLSTDLAAALLAEGELAYTTDTNKLYITDASNNKHLIGGVEQGLLSERPTTGSEGEVYYATDTGEMFFWDGTVWVKTNTTELSELNGTLDDIADGTDYKKVAADDVDVNGHITTIYKDGTPISATEIENKADKVSGATGGNLASLDASGNLVDSGNSPSDFATSSDLTTKADKVSGATDGNLSGLDASGNLTDSGVSPTTVNNKADKVSGATDGNLASLDASGNLVDSGNNPSDFIADTADTVDFLNLQSTAKQVQVDFTIQGAFMDGKSVGEDLLQAVNKHIFKWQLANATLISAASIVLLDDSSSTASINIEINGVEALSSDLSLLETETSGTINASSNEVVTGDRIKITVANTGGASDSENLTLRTVWQFA